MALREAHLTNPYTGSVSLHYEQLIPKSMIKFFIEFDKDYLMNIFNLINLHVSIQHFVVNYLLYNHEK
jgi:flagellar assembly factor FliW